MKRSPKYESFRPPRPPVDVDRSAEVRCSWEELRTAVYQQFYPAIGPKDDSGQTRIDRSTDDVIARVQGEVEAT